MLSYHPQLRILPRVSGPHLASAVLPTPRQAAPNVNPGHVGVSHASQSRKACGDGVGGRSMRAAAGNVQAYSNFKGR